MKLAGKSRQWRPYLFAFLNLAIIHTARNDTAAARELLAGFNQSETSLPDDAQSQSARIIADGLQLLVDGKTLQAAEVFENLSSNNYKDELQNRELQYCAAGMCADMYDVAGLSNRADSMLLGCAREIDSIGNAGNRRWIASLMSDRYARRGDSASAEAWKLRMYRAKDELYRLGSLTGNDGLEFMSRMRKIQEEISAQRAQKRKVYLIVTVMSVAMAILMLLAALYVIRLKRRRRQIQELYRNAMEEIEMRREASVKEVDAELIRRISDVMENSPSVMSVDFSLANLAKEVGSNTAYVSHALNSGFGQSFSVLVARRRVDEACMMLRNRGNDNLTIEAIAEKVGIKSRSNFTATFKRIVGITPAEFRNASRNR